MANNFWNREEQAARDLALPIFLLPLFIVVIRDLFRKGN